MTPRAATRLAPITDFPAPGGATSTPSLAESCQLGLRLFDLDGTWTR
ncbi:MAG TPA: hypothetical protein VFG23_17620 [Polyangia bacterium]|nr:hypothetical protein [Polyangia bacterium]